MPRAAAMAATPPWQRRFPFDRLKRRIARQHARAKIHFRSHRMFDPFQASHSPVLFMKKRRRAETTFQTRTKQPTR
jgi:hypothetical protein